MKIGQHKLGRYHSIIEKIWGDNTRTYETNFISQADFLESALAIRHCLENQILCGMDNPLKIVAMHIYIGQDAINKLVSLV